MKQAKLLFLLIAALAFASCRQTARQTVADAEQPTDSTEAVTSADTLRLVITDKSLSQTDSVIRRTLKLPVDSIVVEVINNTDSTCVTGEAYAIEQRVNDVWTILHIKPRKDGPACSLSMLSLTNTTLSEGRYTASSKSSSRKGRRNRKASIVISKQNDSESVNRASPPSSTSPRNSCHASAAPSHLATKSYEFLNIICSCSFAESKGQPRYITSNLYPRFFSETIEIEVSASSILRR